MFCLNLCKWIVLFIFRILVTGNFRIHNIKFILKKEIAGPKISCYFSGVFFEEYNALLYPSFQNKYFKYC